MIKLVPFIYEDIDDFCANTYVLYDENKSAVVIDPSRKYDGIVNYLKKNDLSLKAILLTHAHYDHMRGINALVENFSCPVVLGFFEEEALTNDRLNLSFYMEKPVQIKANIKTCYENEELNYLNEPIKVIETPYHTNGSISYYVKNSKMLFSGDSLFRLSVGRSDFRNSCPKKMESSLKKLMSLPEDTKIYPGHGSFSIIKDEKLLNPFVKK